MRTRRGVQHAHTACIAGCDGRRSEALDLWFSLDVGLSLHERPIITRLTRLEHPVELKEGMVIALETWCPATGRGVGGTHREGDGDHLARGAGHHAHPFRRAVRRRSGVRPRMSSMGRA